MLTMTREPDAQTGVLLKDFLAWDAHSPEGYRAELIDGGSIPLYLLADRKLRTVTLFSDPKGGDYSRTTGASFGKELPLPAPFSFTLDTSDFAD